MYRVVIVGSRHRGWNSDLPHQLQEGSTTDQTVVRELLQRLLAEHGKSLLLLSLGCDMGFGRMVRKLAEEQCIAFAEMGVRIGEHVPREQHIILLLTRHAALVDIGQEFHVFVARSRFSHVEDLVSRVQVAGLPMVLYAEDGSVIEEGPNG